MHQDNGAFHCGRHTVLHAAAHGSAHGGGNTPPASPGLAAGVCRFSIELQHGHDMAGHTNGHACTVSSVSIICSCRSPKLLSLHPIVQHEAITLAASHQLPAG